MSKTNETVRWLKTVYLKDSRIHSVFSDYEGEPIVVIAVLDQSVIKSIPSHYNGVRIRIEEIDGAHYTTHSTGQNLD